MEKIVWSLYLKKTETRIDNGEIHLVRHIRLGQGISKSYPAPGYGVPLREEGQKDEVFTNIISETDLSLDKHGGQVPMC